MWSMSFLRALDGHFISAFHLVSVADELVEKFFCSFDNLNQLISRLERLLNNAKVEMLKTRSCKSI